MPLVYQQNINDSSKIAVWHITEAEDFFLSKVTLHREISHWHKRLQHLAGRLLLKELYPAFPVELIRIAETKKPFLPDDPLHFSISHCGDYAAALVSQTYRVGVDVELLNLKIEQIQHKFTDAAEQKIFDSEYLPTGEVDSVVDANRYSRQVQCLTLCWSVKESVFKWWATAAVDFKKDIVINSIAGTQEQGKVYVLFKKKFNLEVHYLLFNKNFLTWVLTIN